MRDERRQSVRRPAVVGELNLLYVHGEAIGYGRLGVKLAAALSDKGVDVYDHLPGVDGGDPVERMSKVCNVACWISTPGHARGWWDGQVPVLFSMWEATRLPEAYREHLHHFDTIIVPSQHNVELFSWFHPNVKYVPLGVDPANWSFVPRRPPSDEFVFLIGGSGKRKGTDLAYRAFRTVFPSHSTNADGSLGPPWWHGRAVPKLVFKNPKGEDFYGDRIEMVSGCIPGDAEIDLYARAHCYLQPSRGEGWGLQPAQAIAQGCPTILTGAHGHAAFAHLGYPLSTTFSTSSYFIYGDAGDWWEPNFDELCERMEWVYLNYDEATAFAKRSAETMAAEFSWAASADRFLDALGRDRLVGYSGSGGWYKPDCKLFPVRVLRPWRADIAGDTFFFKPDVTYYETADVKRILFEADLLHPSCLEQSRPDGEEWDSGLTQAQVKRVGAYSARHEFCDSCGQRMNSQPSRSDELMAAP